MIPEIELQRHPDTGELVHEEWRPILNYGTHMVSNYGRVISKNRTHILSGPKGGIRSVSEKLIKGTINKHGYRMFRLAKGKTKSLHRILAEAFIDNKFGYNCVNHLDGNKLNNNLSNLEWCTVSHNNKHALLTGLRRNNSTEIMHNYCKIVYAVKDIVVIEFPSIRRCAKELGVTKRTVNNTILQGTKCRGYNLYL